MRHHRGSGRRELTPGLEGAWRRERTKAVGVVEDEPSAVVADRYAALRPTGAGCCTRAANVTVAEGVTNSITVAKATSPHSS
jgi:hypothetical protein